MILQAIAISSKIYLTKTTPSWAALKLSNKNYENSVCQVHNQLWHDHNQLFETILENIWLDMHHNQLYNNHKKMHNQSSQRWLKEGDKNTLFFHKSLKSNLWRNGISTVQSSEGLVESVVGVKYHIRQHLMNFFKEPCGLRPVPEGLGFKRIKAEVSILLERPFSEDEVKEAV